MTELLPTRHMIKALHFRTRHTCFDHFDCHDVSRQYLRSPADLAHLSAANALNDRERIAGGKGLSKSVVEFVIRKLPFRL